MALFRVNQVDSIFVEFVISGRSTELSSKESPQSISLAAVPVISTLSNCPWVGVPERFVLIEVIFTASAVILWMSQLSTFIVGVALEASLVILHHVLSSTYFLFAT